MTRKVFFLALACVLFLSASLVAADKPNLSGEWKLNVDKSDFGPMPPPNSQVLKITHNEPEFSIQTDQDGMQGKISYTVKCKTDGMECVNELRGTQAKMVAKWEGSALVTTTKLDFQGNELTLVNTSTLSDDGKTLTQVLKITMSQGEFESKQVSEKVEAK